MAIKQICLCYHFSFSWTKIWCIK